MLAQRKTILDILVIIAAFLVLLSVGFWMWYTEQLLVGPPDYCPVPTWPQKREGLVVPGHTVLLIDTSNEIPSIDIEPAFQNIENWIRDETPFLQRLSIYGLPESKSVDSQIIPRCSLCTPKEGSEANRIYENPAFVEAEFQKFLQKIKITFGELVDQKEASQSPIIETINSLILDNEDIDSIVLVSDMLQHTPQSSFYRDEDLPKDACSTIVQTERLKAIYVYYVDRKIPDVQPPEWPDSRWARCLSGVKLAMLN